jgi:hypothetical protein
VKQIIDVELFPIMKRELFYEENDICLLAWLKSNAANEALSENELMFAEYNIQRLVKRGILLPFFLPYKKSVALPDRILDKLIVTYHADPGKRIYIHYRMAKSKCQDYITERMPDTFMGIHAKEFLLFYHEDLQYYITEESEDKNNITEASEDKNNITESYHIRYECDTPEDDESNYNHINLMLMSLEMQDDRTLLTMMEQYAKKEFMISACFGQIES